MKNVVIVGASHAAAEAISSLRKAGWEDKITLVGDETVLPYQRPPLSKAYYKGDVTVDKLAIKNDAFYQKSEFDLLLGRRAVKLNRESKEIDLDDGSCIAYSKLILATGTRARLLPIEGADLPQIKYLRTVSDVDHIKRGLGNGSKLLIVGAGYIGLEVAASAVKQGIEVVVLEAQDRVLARVTSPEVSEFYQTMHGEEGVNIRLDVALNKFAENDGKAYAELSNGEQLDFDCAIVGIGVIPNSELAADANIACCLLYTSPSPRDS